MAVNINTFAAYMIEPLARLFLVASLLALFVGPFLICHARRGFKLHSRRRFYYFYQRKAYS
jgi:hypothetical protein